jgi:hypothetical protein
VICSNDADYRIEQECGVINGKLGDIFLDYRPEAYPENYKGGKFPDPRHKDFGNFKWVYDAKPPRTFYPVDPIVEGNKYIFD